MRPLKPTSQGAGPSRPDAAWQSGGGGADCNHGIMQVLGVCMRRESAKSIGTTTVAMHHRGRACRCLATAAAAAAVAAPTPPPPLLLPPPPAASRRSVRACTGSVSLGSSSNQRALATALSGGRQRCADRRRHQRAAHQWWRDVCLAASSMAEGNSSM
eukprot:TRINITY_DN733_c0_g1_i1.p1 TRINITY_DN733_c0_g1~~TRINITY_DN733_c0_g1_i1.p1  ORF type:complete len:158 (-),score=34.57 TRINITY_DN733_c0_g1_i1:228-701(-)